MRDGLCCAAQQRVVTRCARAHACGFCAALTWAPGLLAFPQTGIPVKQQVLCFAGNNLKDHLSLADHNLEAYTLSDEVRKGGFTCRTNGTVFTTRNTTAVTHAAPPLQQLFQGPLWFPSGNNQALPPMPHGALVHPKTPLSLVQNLPMQSGPPPKPLPSPPLPTSSHSTPSTSPPPLLPTSSPPLNPTHRWFCTCPSACRSPSACTWPRATSSASRRRSWWRRTRR